jgi:uncharacterized protein YndB with AHSA1/START domain
VVIVRTVTVDRPVAEVFAYLSDFTNTEEWDPGTVRTTRVSGVGEVGTTYHNVSRFLGRPTELTYVVTDSKPPRLLRLRGQNKTVVAHDTMSLVETPTGGTELTYRAEFEFKGLARVLAPLAAPAFRRLGDEAERGLRAALAP